MRGVKVSEEKLVFLNTKLESKTKELMAAMIFTMKLDGYRDLFDLLLTCFKEKYPLQYDNALRVLESRVDHRLDEEEVRRRLAAVREKTMDNQDNP